jgi:hypothetical protein
MKKAVAAAVGVAVVATAAVIGLAARSGTASHGYTIGPGVPVAVTDFVAISQDRLHGLGASKIALLGARGDRAYLKIQRDSGETCYAASRAGVARELLDVSCLEGSDQMPTPLIDMSGIAVDPSTGLVLRLVQVEGIAADEVAKVGIEAGGHLVATTPVANNVYRFPKAALPARADAVVALSKSGAELWRKPI